MAEVSEHTASSPRSTPAESSGKRPTATEELQAAKIERAIRNATRDKVRMLKVAILKDRVVLTGRCGTFYCKQLAQHAVLELTEGRLLDNRIEVW